MKKNIEMMTLPLQLADGWEDYALLDTGDGEKLERWGEYILRRPDPQVIWPASEPALWEKADAHYHRSKSGGGHWRFRRELPEDWTIRYGELVFRVHPTNFKHTGLFPEQAVNWSWMQEMIGLARPKRKEPLRVLNLFAYTGGATAACVQAGAEVVHVDAAKGMVQWAKGNLALSNLSDRGCRFLVDDALKFIQREERRGSRYHGLIMDPPSYGRGPRGEIWKLEDSLFSFLQACRPILAEDALFVLVNAYTTGFSPTVLRNLLALAFQKDRGGTVACGEIGLPIQSSTLALPCGIFGRWFDL